ncbi:MAG: hypothetical protein JW867_09220, partial [Candidatus Omnitrophica bacterium]|nr:hypothetical protein [Candidatus Omnitrophota bacterium]
MLILGISDSHDASAALIEDNTILAAVSEERFTRRKRQQGFPYHSIKYLKSFINGRLVDKVYIAGQFGRAAFRVMDKVYSRGDPCKNPLSFSSKVAYRLENSIAAVPLLKNIESWIGLSAVKDRLERCGIKYRSISLLNHHYSHVISSLVGMASVDYLAMSLDAYGDGDSGLLVNVRKGKAVNIRRVSHKDSIAQFYSHISAQLGFQEGEEGQVMALASLGKDTPLTGIFKKLFRVEGDGIRVSQDYKRKCFLKMLGNYEREDVASALQKVCEEATLRLVKGYASEGVRQDIFLAGGFFANIKVNQRLHQEKLFKRIFVFPNMGDGGISFLPVIDRNDVLCRTNQAQLSDVYLGPEYSEEHIERILRKSELQYTRESGVEERVAQLLSEGKTVARFSGRMEYGPRALGNRSILHETTDINVNTWLNRKLKRPKFMPFAPVTLCDFADICYEGFEGAEKAAKFMTIAVDCTEWMKKTSPGVVHVDGTA